MTREAKEILAIAARLSVEERARLAVHLLDSIAAADAQAEIAGAQRAESRSRLDAARTGELELVDDEDAMRMIAE